MVNHLSRCLLAMAMFASVSCALTWRVVSYPLFATGIAAVVLTDFLRSKRRWASAGICIALPGAGLIGGPNPALALIIPIAFLAVLFSEWIVLGKSRRRPQSSESALRDDPLTNMCVALPSAVALLAFLALA